MTAWPCHLLPFNMFNGSQDIFYVLRRITVYRYHDLTWRRITCAAMNTYFLNQRTCSEDHGTRLLHVDVTKLQNANSPDDEDYWRCGSHRVKCNEIFTLCLGDMEGSGIWRRELSSDVSKAQFGVHDREPLC